MYRVSIPLFWFLLCRLCGGGYGRVLSLKGEETLFTWSTQTSSLPPHPPPPLSQAIVDMVEARFPKQEEESMYIGMRKVTAAEYKAYEAFQAKTGGLDPLEVNRKKAKEAAQNK